MLNQQQIKYARGRIDEIYKLKLRELGVKTGEEKHKLHMDAIRGGKILIKEKVKSETFYYSDWRIHIELEIDDKELQDHFHNEENKLLALKTEALDQLILGDEPEAKAALKKLSDYEVQ